MSRELHIGYQRGFLLPLALFVLVAMAALGLTLNRFNSQTLSTVTLDAVSASAFYAAESGGQFAMNQLFYSTTAIPVRSVVTANCGAVNGSTLNLNAPGLVGCQVNITCSASNNLPENSVSFYRITSSATCGSGPFTAERQIALASSLRD